MKDEGCIGGCIGELNLCDIAALDKDEENEWQEVVRRRLTYEQFTVTESRPETRARLQRDGWEWLDQGQARARQDRLEVTDTREPLASVSKIVKKGNWVVLGSDRSYTENVLTGKRIELTEQKETYHLDVDVLTPGFAGPACRMRADACRGRSPRRGCPRMPRPRSTTSHGAFTASVDEESKQGTDDRRQGQRTQPPRCTWTTVS